MTRKVKEFLLFHEIPLWLAWLTVGIFFSFHLSNRWLTNLDHPVIFGVLFSWLFIMVMWNSFEVAHHVECLAESIREPLGTLILTLVVTSIEIVTIVNIMIIGDENPMVARDTMYSIIMIILNGIVGFSLLLGGIKYREQRYNLQGSIEFLSVIVVLAMIGLVLPDFTRTTLGPTLSHGQTVFLIITSLGIYIIFLGMQTISHRAHFISPFEPAQPATPMRLHITYPAKSGAYHAFLLIAYLIPTLLIAKQVAIPVDYTMVNFNTPQELAGLFVAILVLAPEGVSAIRASLANYLQRSVNIALGAALATTALTIPAVLAIGLHIHQSVILGLPRAHIILLLLTFFTSFATFISGRTSILQGALHLLLFLAFILMTFDQ